MSAALIAALAICMVGTAFLSGLFGMAGGLILIGILLALLPLPEAMALHAVTQMASNGWRGLLWWRHIRFGAAAGYLIGSVLGLAVWSLFRYVPDKAVAMLFLGLAPFAVTLLPKGWKPDAARLDHGILYGVLCMSLMLLTGVVGPLIDTFFLGGKLDRREIVATKALCQVAGHTMKLIYFTGIATSAGAIDGTLLAVAIAASLVGTTAARRFLEAMSDAQYRNWSTRIIVSICAFYVLGGLYLLAVPVLAAA
ncbi:MAG: TSUP family transporter [Pseudolabrys sp.]